MEIRQFNCFYNYAIGLNLTEVDLVKTSKNLLKSGFTKAICFSDLKAIYIDEDGKSQVEWIRPEGRQWDSSWNIKFSDKVPSDIVHDLAYCLELSFQEQRIEGVESKRSPPYLRAALPPVVLVKDDEETVLFPWLKIYSDGVMILSFQIDSSLEGMDESDFIKSVVNIFQRYFDQIFVHGELQRLDAELLIPEAFTSDLSLGGQKIKGWRSTRLIKKLRAESRRKLDESLASEGREFEVGDELWLLHHIACADDEDGWESTFDLCRSIYVNAISSLVASTSKDDRANSGELLMWQGRPSVSIMRFKDQPDNKQDLYKKFGLSMSRFLMRSQGSTNPVELPPDLRIFDDYALHGNRALLIWTWLRESNSPDDAWEERNTGARVFENQARAEHFEYLNLKIARACAVACSPSSDESLIAAYKVLSSVESTLHTSSQAGEIIDAVNYLLESVGTKNLITDAKERARWHLDERRYLNDKSRSHIDRWLAVLFGFIGSTGLADLVIHPYLKGTFTKWSDFQLGLSAFVLALLTVGVFVFVIEGVNKLWSK